MAKIQLNGKKITLRTKTTIYDLLKKFKLNNKKVAIEHNGAIVPKGKYKKKNFKKQRYIRSSTFYRRRVI